MQQPGGVARVGGSLAMSRAMGDVKVCVGWGRQEGWCYGCAVKGARAVWRHYVQGH